RGGRGDGGGEMTRGVVCLALIVMLTAAGGAATAAGEQHYTDPAGWSVQYPAGMHLERSHAHLRISVSEVTIATFAPRRPVRSRSTASGGWLRVDPPAGARGRVA